MDPKWLTVAMVKAIQAQSVALYGGPGGIRDEGLLESALDRPRNLHAYGDDPSLYELAAAYCMGIIGNHPFIDGTSAAGCWRRTRSWS